MSSLLPSVILVLVYVYLTRSLPWNVARFDTHRDGGKCPCVRVYEMQAHEGNNKKRQ